MKTIAVLSFLTTISCSLLASVQTLDVSGTASNVFRTMNSMMKPKANDPNSIYRLPSNTRPLEYTLTLVTNIHEDESHKDKFRYSGEVLIKIEVVEPTNTITLHGGRFLVSKTELKDSSSKTISWIDNAQPRYDPSTDFLTCQTMTLLEKGNYTLSVEFNHVLRDDNKGIYRSHYIDTRGLKQWFVATHFQPIYARTAFPCYDEPGIRVPMTLRVNHSRAYQAISKEPVEGTIIL